MIFGKTIACNHFRIRTVRFGIGLGLIVSMVSPLTGQRVLSEATLIYQITSEATGKEGSLAEALKDATQTIWIRGNEVRVDFTSPFRLQTTFYSGKNGSAVLLRESGMDKYQWNLDSAQWRFFNRKWDDATYTDLNETSEIAGYSCRKVQAILKDSSQVIIYYSRQAVPIVRGYDILLEPIAGLPIQYEMVIEGYTITYTLSSLQTTPIGASRFDIPKSGYKLIEPTAQSQ